MVTVTIFALFVLASPGSTGLLVKLHGFRRCLDHLAEAVMRAEIVDLRLSSPSVRARRARGEASGPCGLSLTPHGKTVSFLFCFEMY